MKLAQYTTASGGPQQVGILTGQGLLNLAHLARATKRTSEEAPSWLLDLHSTMEIIQRGDSALEEIRLLVDRGMNNQIADDLLTPPDNVEFLPPVQPGKILAIGRNYVEHASEQGKEPPAAPMLFNKLPNSLNAHNAPIIIPSISSKVDYEAELAVIIGRRARRVLQDEALTHVFGYAPINDVSARDLQFGDGQWTRGKGLDTFAPLGPYITTRDEIPDVHNLKIEGRLNGQVMQSSNTGKMIFNVPFLISYLSQAITLEAGDVIATGTPEGVGIFREPPVLLRPGDVFEVEIEKLGILRNPVIASA